MKDTSNLSRLSNRIIALRHRHRKELEILEDKLSEKKHNRLFPMMLCGFSLTILLIMFLNYYQNQEAINLYLVLMIPAWAIYLLRNPIKRFLKNIGIRV